MLQGNNKNLRQRTLIPFLPGLSFYHVAITMRSKMELLCIGAIGKIGKALYVEYVFDTNM